MGYTCKTLWKCFYCKMRQNDTHKKTPPAVEAQQEANKTIFSIKIEPTREKRRCGFVNCPDSLANCPGGCGGFWTAPGVVPALCPGGCPDPVCYPAPKFGDFFKSKLNPEIEEFIACSASSIGPRFWNISFLCLSVVAEVVQNPRFRFFYPKTSFRYYGQFYSSMCFPDYFTACDGQDRGTIALV